MVQNEKKLVKPVKKTKLLKKTFLFGGTTGSDNENCNCCANVGCGK